MLGERVFVAYRTLALGPWRVGAVPRLGFPLHFGSPQHAHCKTSSAADNDVIR